MEFQWTHCTDASLAAVTLNVQMTVTRAQAAVIVSQTSLETTARRVQTDTIISPFA